MSKKRVPKFFIYHNGDLYFNTPVLKGLSTNDVVHLSQAEREFVAWYKEECKQGKTTTYYGFPRCKSQEEECRILLKQIEIDKQIDAGQIPEGMELA